MADFASSDVPAYAQWDVSGVPQTPAYIVNLAALRENARLLDSVRNRTGCRILLALKGFAMFGVFDQLRASLDGTTSSGLHEALLAKEFFAKEIHVYSPAFKTHEIEKLAGFAHSVVFNSTRQLNALRPLLQAAAHPPEVGLRVNPEYAEVEVPIYNPCAPGSRLGATADALVDFDFTSLDGLHFHTMCEQDSDVLERTLQVFERKFGHHLHALKWVNFGGGHHITRPQYDVDRLCRLIEGFRDKYGLEVYLEPGEAIAIRTGVLVTEVLDIVACGGIQTAILDTSATCHMPDTLEMPYRADIVGAGLPGEFPHNYRLGGLSCLAGDVMGDYSFPQPLRIGQRLTFLDMAHYTMVKTTTFNGVPLPAIGTYEPDTGELRLLRKPTYADYRDRLS